jgi:hypothetical protein
VVREWATVQETRSENQGIVWMRGSPNLLPVVGGAVAGVEQDLKQRKKTMWSEKWTTGREAHPEHAGIALGERLAGIVAVVGGTVAGVKQKRK